MYYVSCARRERTAATLILETRKHLKQLQWIKPRLIIFKLGLIFHLPSYRKGDVLDIMLVRKKIKCMCMCVIQFPKPMPAGNRKDCVFSFVSERFWSWWMLSGVACCIMYGKRCCISILKWRQCRRMYCICTKINKQLFFYHVLCKICILKLLCYYFGHIKRFFFQAQHLIKSTFYSASILWLVFKFPRLLKSILFCLHIYVWVS